MSDDYAGGLGGVPWWVREAAQERAEAAEVRGVSDVVRGPAQDAYRGRVEAERSVGDRIREADPLLFAELVGRGAVDADGLLRLIRDECRKGVTSSECDVVDDAAVLGVLWERLALVARWVDAYLGVVDVTDAVVEGLAQRVADDVARTIRGYLDGQG